MSFKEFFTTNSWWGKLLGAFFGFLASGPTGALFGLLVGNFFDRGLNSHFSNPHWLYHAQRYKDIQKVFFELTFSVMGHIAKADGRVSEKEVEMARVLMSEMRLNTEQTRQAKKLYNEGKLSDFNLEHALSQLQRTCGNNRELIKLFVDIQYRASQVDGLNAKKIKALDSIFTKLGFAPLHKQYRFHEEFTYRSNTNQNTHSSSNQRHRPHAASVNSLSGAYALLEITPQANKQEVKRAYRRLMSRNHPDKLIAQGLPPEMIKIANDKTQQIGKAYDLICESKGW